MRRRDFIAVLSSASLALPLAARAQRSAMPVIGVLHPQSPEPYAEPMRGFRQGLKDAGFVDGENLMIEYRWADNQIERLPTLAAELVRRGVAVIVATGGYDSALAAKAATTTIPIVFNVAQDPVSSGLVASLARPGGNLTGINILLSELAAKRLEFLRELVPGAARITVLITRTSTTATEWQLRDVEAAARTLGLAIQVLNANTSREIDAAFENIGRERPDALFVTVTPFFVVRRVQLVHLATLHRLPAIYGLRDFAESGGLMSYGSSLKDAYRQVGVHTGRVLNGTKPADLPVVQSSKFELVINAQTARTLGLTIPPSLLATADEVIE
jgi:putative tryptophan/tyrosine transport system substrate-binding protein